MNSLSATGYGAPDSLLDALTRYVAIRIPWLDQRFGLRSIAASAGDAAPMASVRPDVATGQKTAGANTYDRFQREMVPHLDAAYNFARFLSRNPDAAQDIVQEAFLRAYRAFDGYQGGDARAWIFSIVRNCYHNWLLEARRKARVEIDAYRPDGSGDVSIDEVADDADTPEAALLRSSEAGKVRNVLNRLPRSLREVMVLRELEGFSYRQIAETAALPIGTVMSRLARARLQFQNLWREEAGLQERQT